MNYLSTIKRLGQSLTFLRLASLIAGTTLWFYVLNSEPVRVERDFPLRLLLPEGQVIANEWPQTVKIELKGARVFLETMQPSGLEVIAEVAATPKRQNLRLVSSMVPTPFGVEVVSIIPDMLPLQLTKESSKTIKVRPMITGDAGPDVAFDIERVEPSIVKVIGPWNLLKDLRDLPTATLSWSELDPSKGVVKVALRDIDSRIRVDGAQEVEIFYKVKPKKANMTLKNIPIRFLSTSRRISSRVKEVALDVLVSEQNSALLTKDRVQVIADIPEGKKGQMQVDLRAVLPDGVHLLQIHPASISISVK